MTKNSYLFIISGLHIGGAEQMLLKLARTFQKKGISFSIICLTSGGALRREFQKSGIPIYSIWNFGKIISATHLVGWMYHGNLVASWLGLFFGKRVVHNIRQSLQTFSQEKLFLKTVIRSNAIHSAFAAAVIYNSSLAKNQHEKMLNFAASKSHVIPNGFPDFEFIPPSEKSNIVLNVGRYHRDKDQESFVKAAVKVLEKNIQAEFWLAGRDLVERNVALTDLIPARYRPHFKFWGEVKEMPKLYSQASVFVLSSIAEAFPNVLGEAMGSGLLCVATQVGDAAAILNDPQWIVPPGEPSVMAEKIMALLDLSPAEKDKLGQRNHQRIRDHYSMDHVADLYLNVF